MPDECASWFVSYGTLCCMVYWPWPLTFRPSHSMCLYLICEKCTQYTTWYCFWIAGPIEVWWRLRLKFGCLCVINTLTSVEVSVVFYSSFMSHFAPSLSINQSTTYLFYRQGAVTALNSLSVITKYTLPCCRANYVCYVKQNRRSKHSNEQA